MTEFFTGVVLVIKTYFICVAALIGFCLAITAIVIGLVMLAERYGK